MAMPDTVARTTKLTLFEVLRAEAEVATERRLQRLRDRTQPRAAPGPLACDGRAGAASPQVAEPLVAKKSLAAEEMAEWIVEVAPLREGESPVLDDFDQPVPCMSSRREIVGLSLSGGGVRSAAFCLGVLQGLDAVVPDDSRPQILDAVDYLSTVSGGGYMGGSLVAGTLQTGGKFPFTSKFDQMETPATQHLRDYSNYLAPSGGLDWVVGAVVLLRGLLINAMLIFGLVFVASFSTVLIYRSEQHLGSDWVPGLRWIAVPFLWTGIVFMLFIVLQLPIVAKIIGLSPSRTAPLESRERMSRTLAYMLLGVGIVLVLDLQSFVLKGLFDAVHLKACRPSVDAGHIPSCRALMEQTGWIGRALSRAGLGSGPPWGSLAAGVAALGAFGTKLVKVASATSSDRSWAGFLKHWSSRIVVAVGSLVVPLAIWAVYLSLCFAAIQAHHAAPGSGGWAVGSDGHWSPGWTELTIAYGTIGIVFLAACFFVPTNANSLHDYYRDRLSRAFLWTKPATPGAAAGARPDQFKLSDLIPASFGGTGAWPGARFTAPYLIVNTAVNLEGSKYANRRGRNADSFTFSALYSGSAATGYAATSALQVEDPHLDLATAMAISGAAASANMGASTIRPLTFSLAVLNVRLGYWLPNPGRLSDWTKSWIERSWPVSFTREAAGQLDEKRPLVYLTDGGHFDNLGIYELLKRRCKVIITADAEADPPMNFESLVRLERCARIDLGIRIDLPWEDLRRWSRRITVDEPHGPKDDPVACIGPHVAIGRIQYTDDDLGVLVYIKACITGDENDLIRDYRRRNPDFPHETTIDQFFTEEQFEVYRALGFHATNSFFSGQDRFGFKPSHADTAWTDLVRNALKRLNIPQDAVTRIMARQVPKQATNRPGGADGDDGRRPEVRSDVSTEPPSSTCGQRAPTVPVSDQVSV